MVSKVSNLETRKKTGDQCLVHYAFEIRNLFRNSLIKCDLVSYFRTQQVMWHHQFCETDLNQINHLDMVMVHMIYWFIKMFLF